MEKQGHCYYSDEKNYTCALAEDAPKCWVNICQEQDEKGCKMMEKSGYCLWKKKM